MRTRSLWGGLGLVLVLLAPVAGQAQPDELSKLRKEVEALRAEVKELRRELAKLRGEPNKEMIVGAWEWVQNDKDFVRITFAQDGRYGVKSTSAARLTTTGSYSVKGDTLTLNYKTPGTGGTQTLKIEKLTDAELVLRDEKGKLEPYKRIAPK